jgi:hypothetical protein
MKIAIFGCSHTGSGPKEWNETWPFHLYRSTKLEINNFAIGGSSTQFQYDLFQKNINSFDKFIFQFTAPNRLTKQTGPINQILFDTYTYFPYNTENLERSTPSKYNKEYKRWIKNDNGEILKEYTKICKEVSSHNKCLFAFYMMSHHSNVQGLDVMQDIFPNIIISNDIHLESKENQVIAKYIKEKCKL